jgi:hypothetical protein
MLYAGKPSVEGSRYRVLGSKVHRHVPGVKPDAAVLVRSFNLEQSPLRFAFRVT